MIKLIFLCFSLLVPAWGEKIELFDGTVIYGDFEGVIDDYYVVRTKYGVLSISKSDILSPVSVEISSQTAIETDKQKNLKIIIHKSTDGYNRNFYDGDIIIGTQIFSSSGVFISSSGFIKDGTYYEYDENNNMLSERTIKDGIENGPVIEFYPDGIIKSRIDFKDGKINGKAFFYTPDSKLVLEQSYSDGVLDGFSVEYDSDGNIKSRVLYSKGELANNIIKKDQEKDTEVKPEEKKPTQKDEFSTKTLKIARGQKIFIYKNNKYIGSFTVDDSYNIIDVTGKIPDRDYEIVDKGIKQIFSFDGNTPTKLRILKGETEEEFGYVDFKAVKSK